VDADEGAASGESGRDLLCGLVHEYYGLAHDRIRVSHPYGAAVDRLTT